MDHYQIITMKCPEDATTLKTFNAKEWLYDFLVELNPKFDQARVQILRKEDLTSLEATSLICVKESRQSVMLDL